MDRKLIVCNYRSAGSEAFCRSVGLLVMDYRPNIVVLFETRVNVERAQNICRKIGFDDFHAVVGAGFSGGISVA